jgi:hypothetical protein
MQGLVNNLIDRLKGVHKTPGTPPPGFVNQMKTPDTPLRSKKTKKVGPAFPSPDEP